MSTEWPPCLCEGKGNGGLGGVRGREGSVTIFDISGVPYSNPLLSTVAAKFCTLPIGAGSASPPGHGPDTGLSRSWFTPGLEWV